MLLPSGSKAATLVARRTSPKLKVFMVVGSRKVMKSVLNTGSDRFMNTISVRNQKMILRRES